MAGGFADLLGGLSTIGGQAAAGGFQGLVAGETARRKFVTEELQNQLRGLEMAYKGQQIAQGQVPQATHIGNGQIMVRDPRTGAVSYERGPVDPSTAAWTDARINRADAQAEHFRRPPVVSVEQQALADWKADPRNAGKSVLDFTREQYAARQPAARPMSVAPGGTLVDPVSRQPIYTAPAAAPRPAAEPAPQYKTDAQGNVVAIVPRRNPDGSVRFETQRIGPYGTPQRPPASLVPRVTTTETTKIIPGKPITDRDMIDAMRTALPNVVNELAGDPRIQGWMSPGALVRIEGSPAPVRREDVIRRALLHKFKADVSVAWNGKQWVLVGARYPTRREPVETRRTVGPPSQAADDRGDDPDEQD